MLRAITVAAAHDTGALLVAASEVTRDHHACAPQPWVTGWSMPPTPFHYGPVAYHATIESNRAVAEAIDKALGAQPQ